MKVKLTFRIWVEDVTGFFPYETIARAEVDLDEEQSEVIAKGLNQGRNLRVQIIGTPSMSWDADKKIWKY